MRSLRQLIAMERGVEDLRATADNECVDLDWDDDTVLRAASYAFEVWFEPLITDLRDEYTLTRMLAQQSERISG